MLEEQDVVREGWYEGRAVRKRIHILYKGKAGAFHSTVDGSNSWGPVVHKK